MFENFKQNIRKFLSYLLRLANFVALITVYIAYQLIKRLLKKLRIGQNSAEPVLYSRYSSLINKLDSGRDGSISRVYLIEIALKNMAAKRTRSAITMGGMALGIGLIVLLVSIGYGLEQLVISRVARLDELRQAEVVPGLTEELLLTDKTISEFEQIPSVTSVIPVISAVGKVNFNNSQSDMAVYGVTKSYLEASAIKPSYGTVFESDELVVSEEMVKLETENDNKTEDGLLETVVGQTALITDGSLPIVKIASLSAKKIAEKVDTIVIGGTKNKELVINQAALSVLAIDANQAVGVELDLILYVVDNGQKSPINRVQSAETKYKIIGLIPDDSAPVIYIPFIDARSLGVNNFSQIKVIVENKEDLENVRTSIESAGYGTISVVDTIGQIDNLFRTVRTFLATLGIVAVSVAALGMFNTLTVSLLERTHEVGLMKAIGMKSSEVEELFMTESMIMGFFGGIFGLVIGILVGFLISLLLSLFVITKGAGFLNITYVPIGFSLLILAVSLFVGIVTGLVPARRAMRISALDALRYE